MGQALPAVVFPLFAAAATLRCPQESILGAGTNGVPLCCPAACEKCGGRGGSFLADLTCSSRPGGADSCCGKAILKSGALCAEARAPPCILQEASDPNPMIDIRVPKVNRVPHSMPPATAAATKDCATLALLEQQRVDGWNKWCVANIRPNQSLAALEDKAVSKELMRRVAPLLQVPTTYFIASEPSAISRSVLSSLPASFVMKGTAGSGQTLISHNGTHRCHGFACAGAGLSKVATRVSMKGDYEQSCS